MSVDVATLGIRVDSSGAITGLNTVESGLSRVTKAAAALGVTLGAGAIFAKLVRETIASQDAMAQLEARVKSTGMAAGLSAAKLDEMSLALARQTTYGDEAIKGAQALLLTFTKIKGDTFPAATLAVANLATAMGGDLKGAALQVGKALQDPAQGLLALRRSGVSFSEAQQDVIKNLFATGKRAEAQRLILKELEVEFGGAAAAARNTLGGALKALGEEFGNLFEVSRESSSGIVKFINLINTQIQALALTFGGQKAIMRAAFSTEAPETMARHLKNVEQQMKAIGDQWTRQGFQTETERKRLNELSEEYGVLTDLLREAAAGQKALGEATDTTTKITYAMALADERAARAKELLNAQVKAALDLEEKLARGVRFDLPKKLPMQAAGIGDAPAKVGDSTGSLVTAAAKVQDAITRNSLAESAKRAAGEVAAWFAANKEMEQIRENFLRGTQEAFAKTFEDIFSKGIKSFGDLFSRLGDLIKQAAAQWAASGLMNMLAGKKGEDGSRTGGLGALVSAHPVIAGVVALGASIVAMGARAKQAAKDVEAMAKALNHSLGQYRADAGLQPQEDTAIAEAKARAERLRADIRAKAEREIDAVNANMWTTRWHKEKRAAEIWAAAQKELDKVSEAEKALIALREKQAAAAEAARAAEAAWNTSRARDDLKVRDLTLRGLTDEAEAQALFNAQVREYAAAMAEVNRGLLSEEFLKELSAIQERERGALAAQQAANKAAEAERKLTEAREKAAAQLSAFQDLEVEMLQAKGQTAEAEQRAFELEQQRRLEEAQKNQTAEYVAKLKELQELQRQNRAAAMAGGGAAAAVVEAQASTASNVFAGADTVTASFGTKVSAEVGDRMLDNLVSIRVILRAIEANTRNLGGKINTSLGLSLSDQYALSGSSVLS